MIDNDIKEAVSGIQESKAFAFAGKSNQVTVVTPDLAGTFAVEMQADTAATQWEPIDTISLAMGARTVSFVGFVNKMRVVPGGAATSNYKVSFRVDT